MIIANNPYPAEVVKANPQLKLIDVAFTGIDHGAQEAANELGIQIANATGYATTTVCELLLGLVLALYRQIPKSDANTRIAADFPGPFQGIEINDKTVGIIGRLISGWKNGKIVQSFWR